MTKRLSQWYTSVAALTVATVVVMMLVAPPAVHGDQQEPVRISHQPTETHQIPPAGTLMPISVQLQNSSEVDIKIRLVGSRDGRFMDIAFPMGVFNSSDKPTFTIHVPAPTKAMTYQFIIHQKGGDLTLTERFVIKRNCEQKYKVDVPEELPSAEFRRQMATLVAKARSLEHETQNLETAIKLIEGLKRDITE